MLEMADGVPARAALGRGGKDANRMTAAIERSREFVHVHLEPTDACREAVRSKEEDLHAGI